MLGSNELRQRIAEIRARNIQERESTKWSFWTRKDRMFHGVGDVSYAILDTGGCRWAQKSGGCSMCGFSNDSCSRPVSSQEIEQQVDGIISRMPVSGKPFGLRVFTSGSFFDEREIEALSRDRMLEKFSKIEGLSELTVESRPEHVTEDRVRHLVEGVPNTITEVAIGLESSSDQVREGCIGKGFSFAEFTRASGVIRGMGSRCKAYILLKPPFLSEYDAAYDSVQSMVDAEGLVDAFSLNACNDQKGTLVEDLHRSGGYRPPWIWTVNRVLKEARGIIKEDIPIICDTVAFGTRRGPHNCRRCDKRAKASVNRFSLTQDSSSLNSLDCSCRGDWEREFHYHF